MSDRATNAAPKISTAELDRLATEAGMMSVLLDGAGSFVWSAGCNGVLAEHLERFAELVTARALAAQAATAEPVAWHITPSSSWGGPVLTGWSEQVDNARSMGCAITPLYAAPVGQAGQRVYLVPTGETYEGQETYTRHDERVPMCDQEVLFIRPQPVGQAEDAARHPDEFTLEEYQSESDAEDATRRAMNLLPRDYLLGVCSSRPDGAAVITLRYASMESAQAVFEGLTDAIDAARAQQAGQAETGEPT